MSMSIALVPISFFAFLAIVIVMPLWLRNRTRALALRTISEAIEKGRDTDVALIERLLMPPQPAIGKGFALLNLFLGVGSLCVGIALALVRLTGIVSGADAAAGIMVGSLVNGGIGIGLTALGIASLRFLSGMHRPAPRWDYATILALVTLFLGVSGLGVCAGLTLAAHIYVAPAMGEPVASGMMIGALVNGCSGVGFTVLGVFILRTFAVYKDS